MAGVDSRRVRRAIRLIAAAVGALLLAVGVLSLPSVAQADPAHPTSLVITAVDSSGGLSTASGFLTVLTTNDPVVGATITLTVNGGVVGSAITGADGSFALSFASPAPGSYVIKAKFDGDALSGPATTTFPFTIEQPKSDTTVAVTLDSDSVEPGSVIGVSGTLTNAAGGPVDMAQVNVTCSWGGGASMAVTGADGTFETSVSLPDSAGGPSSVTVTVTFDGDDVYNGNSGQAVVAVVAAPPETTAPAESEPTAEATATSTKPSATQTAVSTPSMVASLDPAFAAEGGLLLSVLGGVAAAGVIALIAIGIISNQRHRLATGEQRGFGSDFGKHEH